MCKSLQAERLVRHLTPVGNHSTCVQEVITFTVWPPASSEAVSTHSGLCHFEAIFAFFLWTALSLEADEFFYSLQMNLK